MSINFILHSNNSDKAMYNQRLEDKMASTTARLTAELDILRNRDANLAISNITAPKTSVDTQQTLISKHIEDILAIRDSLGITEAKGANKPLEELFQSYKGSIIDNQL